MGIRAERDANAAFAARVGRAVADQDSACAHLLYEGCGICCRCAEHLTVHSQVPAKPFVDDQNPASEPRITRIDADADSPSALYPWASVPSVVKRFAVG